MYSSVAKRMIDDAQRIENYHIIYFEDLIAEPAAIIRKVYGYAGLNIDAVEKFGLQSKESMDKDGVRRVTFGQRKQRVWSRLGEIEQYVREDVNVNQIARLKDADKEAFLRYAREPMEYFGYLGARRETRALESAQVC